MTKCAKEIVAMHLAFDEFGHTLRRIKKHIILTNSSFSGTNSIFQAK